MKKIVFYAERPNIAIDDAKFILHWKEVQLAELLWKRRPHWVDAETLRGALECSPRSLRLYAMNLRTVLRQYKYTVEGKKERGLDGDRVKYRITDFMTLLKEDGEKALANFKRRNT